MSGWQVTVRGIPGPQGSKNQWGQESSAKVKPWREAVRGEVQDALEDGAAPVVGPARVDITFLMPRPKSHYRTGKRSTELRDSAPDWSDKLPDLDKLCRSTLDALSQAGAFGDDRQVAVLIARKRYGTDFVGAVIEVSPVPSS